MIATPATPEIFDCWAAVYDEATNPFLAIETRLLDRLLPRLEGKTVLDLGCGTGRHFDLFTRKGTAFLHGVDYSEQMLEIARQRLSQQGSLHCADCTEIPLPDACIDVVVCSFVLGYIRDLQAFCQEMKRLMHPGGQLFLADIHPGTAERFAWRRTFQAASEEISIEWNHKNLPEIHSIFEHGGFHIQSDLAVPFSETERHIFADCGRSEAFEKIRSEPALYLLQAREESLDLDYNICNARFALSDDVAVHSTLGIGSNKVRSLRQTSSGRTSNDISLDGYMLLPGLINAHDHLEFGLFPRLGAGPYQDATEWAEDIHTRYADLIALHRNIPRDVRVRWGAIRNLLCGVTTTCHHNPLTPAMLDPDFPVRVVEKFQWIHSPAFDPDGLKAQVACRTDQPFVLHAGEGTSERARNELKDLSEAGLMRPGTVLVHGLAIAEDEIGIVQQSGVGLILCPSSNDFLYGATPAPDLMNHLQHTAVGSDSPLTACGDLLDEAAYASARYNLAPEKLYAMLLVSPAELLKLPAGCGQVQVDGLADLIAIKDRGISPAQTLQSITWRDIHLIIRGGVIQMASSELLRVIPREERGHFTQLIVDGEPRWIRGYLSKDFEATVPVQENGSLRLGGKVVSLA